MRRRRIAGTEAGTPEQFCYKGFAESDSDNIPHGEYTEEELRHMAANAEQNKVPFASVDFSQYSKISYSSSK